MHGHRPNLDVAGECLTTF